MFRSLVALIILPAAITVAQPATAGPMEDGGIAIIDVSDSTTGEQQSKRLEKLQQAGVLVVGRYYARCRQYVKNRRTGKWELWRKRLIDNDPAEAGGEAKSLLTRFALLSIYQYRSNIVDKFTTGLPDPQPLPGVIGPICDPATNAAVAAESPSPRREAILDAEAAVRQAHLVNQPPKTAIYFGVDFLFDKSVPAQKNGVLVYFTEVKRILDAADYRVGAYGDGDALELLKENHKIELAWLSPSAAFPGSTGTDAIKKWDLFQSQADNRVFVSGGDTCVDLEYDTNIQNPQGNKDLGFWTATGGFQVPDARTKEIFDQRRFVCDRRSLKLTRKMRSCADLRSNTSKEMDCSPTPDGEPCFAKTVRVLPGGETSVSARIDFRDDGTFNHPSFPSAIESRRLSKSLKERPPYRDAPWSQALCP